MVDMNEIKEKAVNVVKKAVDLNILKPVHARVQERMRELKLLTSAKHTKIKRGNIKNHYTESPKMFVCKLSSSIVNGVGTISYEVYKMDGKDKFVEKETEMRRNPKGEEYEHVVNMNYPIEKTVIETIEFRKKLKYEEIME